MALFNSHYHQIGNLVSTADSFVPHPTSPIFMQWLSHFCLQKCLNRLSILSTCAAQVPVSPTITCLQHSFWKAEVLFQWILHATKITFWNTTMIMQLPCLNPSNKPQDKAQTYSKLPSLLILANCSFLSGS